MNFENGNFETPNPNPNQSLSMLENLVASGKDKRKWEGREESETTPSELEEIRNLQVKAYDAMEWGIKNEINTLSQESFLLLPGLLKVKLEDLAKKNSGLLDWQIKAAQDKKEKIQRFADTSNINDLNEQNKILDKYGLNREEIDFASLRKQTAA